MIHRDSSLIEKAFPSGAARRDVLYRFAAPTGRQFTSQHPLKSVYSTSRTTLIPRRSKQCLGKGQRPNPKRINSQEHGRNTRVQDLQFSEKFIQDRLGKVDHHLESRPSFSAAANVSLRVG